MEQTLNKEEIEFFYQLLYRYERESHAGYQDETVLGLIGSKIEIDDMHNDKENISTEKDNCLQFPHRRFKCLTILYHIRNAFAHGNIESIENGSTFLIKDFSDKSKRSKCNMLGKIDKNLFYELIGIMESTRKKTNKNNNKKTRKL